MASPDFADIDAQTRSQIETDLLEAAARGISGDAGTIAESFEAVITEYLSMDPDLKRSFPRGETARIYGTALGDALVRGHGFTWKLLSDAYGTDLVVAENPERYTAPIVVVDSRFEDEEPGRLTAFLQQFL
ncbi:DUF3806 domain-containing protein [Corynebacterium qintianiae]|uniref:DUF3806 domain-containing protein n=1 Tax=Corynebacterium qintianiae TaxID=2709392 RepID=A0A7T0KNC3_9CORY|nr:DUF3806 domain-containing protein [Corynebacterium qintianiae]QPK83840.1 DUF3806 domain-containing protein [Corynebacterium qintianiae]